MPTSAKKWYILIGTALFGLIATMAPDPSACAPTKHTTGTGWRALAGRRLSSVAWSPDGRYVAFVATPKIAPAERAVLPAWADIWLLETPVKSVHLKRLVHLHRSQGIPLALFWISNDRIGWAGCVEGDSGFAFFGADLTNGRPRPLVPHRFRFAQERAYAEVFAPDDLFWNRRSGEILFSSGSEPPDGDEKGFLRKVRLHGTPVVKTIPLGLAMGPGAWTLCGVPGSREIYLAGAEWRPTRGPGTAIGYSKSGRLLQPTQVSALYHHSGEMWFPRLSPDKRRLACLLLGGRGVSYLVQDRVVLLDLRTRAVRTAAMLSSYWQEESIGMGCPFSWSPSGKEIAYADGSVIKTVAVPH